MPFFTFNNCRIFYEERGTGPCLVYLHEWNASSLAFRKFNLPRLATEVRVVCLDLPGYGRSGWPDHFDFNDLPALLRRLLDHLSVERCTLAGFCLGAPVALAFYERYPARVRALILIEPVVRYPAILLPLLLPGFGVSFLRLMARSRLLYSLVGSQVIGPDRRVRDQVFRGIGRTDPRISFRYLKMLFRASRRRDVRSMRVNLRENCLMITGEQSYGLFRKNAALLLRLFAIRHAAIVHGARHFVLVEQPEETAVLILRFMKEGMPGAGANSVYRSNSDTFAGIIPPGYARGTG